MANGSPIGDSMPLLIALDAQVVLINERGPRTMPLEQFYTGYRVQVLGNLLQRFWLESQGMQQINLDAFTLAGENT